MFSEKLCKVIRHPELTMSKIKTQSCRKFEILHKHRFLLYILSGEEGRGAGQDGTWILEGKFTDQKLSGLLVSLDLAESDGSWPEPLGIFNSSSCCNSESFGGKLLSWSFNFIFLFIRRLSTTVLYLFSALFYCDKLK